MSKLVLTENLARLIAQDAANEQMRIANRKAWSREDYSLATEIYEELVGKIINDNNLNATRRVSKTNSRN